MSRVRDLDYYQDIIVDQRKEIQRLTKEVERLDAMLKEVSVDPAYVRSRIAQAETYRAQAAHSKLKADALERELASAREVLKEVMANVNALTGTMGHRLGCDCGGTNDGQHSCRSLNESFSKADAWIKEHGR